MTGQSETETDPIDVNGLEERRKKVDRKRVSCFVCSYGDCKAVFRRPDRLNRHLRQHTGERPFICSMDGCLRSFTCKSYLNKHLKRPHNLATNGKTEERVKKCLKQYICSECEKQFKSKFQLRIHCFTHSGEKPFECQTCDKRFPTQTKLKSHLKTHEGYSCGRNDCDYKTSKWSELRKHISDSHKVCQKCNICNKMFKNSYNLGLHKESIHENNCLIVCTYDNCNKSYTKKNNLMAHIRSKHENKLFNCTEEGCDKTFVHKKSLKEHLKNHSMPQKLEPKKEDKKVRRRVSKASKITGNQLNDKQIKEILVSDLEFRNKTLDK